MQCPNCFTSFKVGPICPRCHVDTVLYTGIIKLSDRLYNKGLERLKISDYYHGIDYLRKSIAVNKNNVPARNLLGLALYETGHVGEALQHWVLSKSLLTGENPADRYINEVRKEEKQLEQLNDAATMFNRALDLIKQASDDLAIIQLKKAVESNPRFIDAYNLLTLCHLIQEDRESANAALEKVLALDAYNPVALNYYSLLNPNKAKPVKSVAPSPPKLNLNNSGAAGTAGTAMPFKPVSVKSEKKGFPIAEILTFFIGALVVFAAYFFIFIPGIESDHEDEMAGVIIQANEQSQIIRSQLETSLARETTLSSQVDVLEDSITNYRTDVDELTRIILVHQAYWLFLEEEFQRAVDEVDDIMVDDLPFDIIRRVDSILDGSYPYLGVFHFTEGISAFNNDDQDGAIESFELAYRFLRPRADEEEYPAQWNQLLFTLGSLYYEDGRFDEAYTLLSELTERAPNVETATVTSMLESIEAHLP